MARWLLSSELVGLWSLLVFRFTIIQAQITIDSTPEALNTTNSNLVPQAPGGPQLYYNGTGDVPAYTETSPEPIAITPLNSSSLLENAFYTELYATTNGTYLSSGSENDDCIKCLVGAQIMHLAAITLPVENFVNLAIRICEVSPMVQSSIYAVNCAAAFGMPNLMNTNTSGPYRSGASGNGPYYAQLFSKMSGATNDFNTYCYYTWNVCPAPPAIGIDESLYFDPKPDSAEAVPTPSNQTFNVLHLSDWHLDSRYDVGSEANCSRYVCCGPYSTDDDISTGVGDAGVPAGRFGYLYCDSPAGLALSSLSGVPRFFSMSGVSFSICTGDIVSHDDDDQISRAYVEYEEEVTYQTLKAYLGQIPVYATLGNHDSLPVDFNTQNSLNPNNGTGANAMSWNYEMLSSLWSNYSWINSTEAGYVATHYGAYAHTTAQGLRIISINTDFWYTGNAFNFWNVSNPDNSGILSFLAQELSICEAQNQRAWIIGHVPSGYDGGSILVNPSALFSSTVRRFSPATIAGVFFGHTHEDQIQIFYDYLPNSTYTVNGVTVRNTSMVDYSKPLQVAYIGPSITPLTGLNAGYQLYQVDASTFSVMGTQTYFANVSEANSWTTPVWEFEYDVRYVYGAAASEDGSIWPSNAPLNATFWDGVTRSMLNNGTLVELYNLYETKSSVVTENCTSAACQQQKVCYIRSGSAELGSACGNNNGPF